MKWEIINKKEVSTNKELISLLLENRGIKTAKAQDDFFLPKDPTKISLKSVGILSTEIKKAISRIKIAKKNNEHVIIYGDYDADGITGTAILWEALHSLGVFVLPHIPERFSEGYGINLKTVKKLKEKDPKLSLIITVDHGIVAEEKIKIINKLGIDVIITDHHQAGNKLPKPQALIYTTKISGSAVAWFLAREVSKDLIREKLSLAAIGTIADQLPLTGINHSIVKFGLIELNNTKRPGLIALREESKLKEIGTYEVGFIIAPRINSMGRLKHGLESLRLLCTRDLIKAKIIAKNIGDTNLERQKIVDEVVLHARNSYKNIKEQLIIVLAHEKYHEGVIGLAAAKLVEEFYRPAVVLSLKDNIAKASARSIAGFNIIEAIRNVNLHTEGGGHPMAAGFSINSNKISEFTDKINKFAVGLLTSDMLIKKIKIDCQLKFSQISNEFINILKKFEPLGLGNPSPLFISNNVVIEKLKIVGSTKSHYKLQVRQDLIAYEAIFFNGAKEYPNLKQGEKIDLVYAVEENIWNGNKSIQLKIRDLSV